jgi:hypothetical protein
MRRRALIKGLGAFGAAALAGIDLGDARLRAQRRSPTRFVAIITPNGTIRSAWGTRRTDTRFTLGEVLAPLEPLRDQLLVLQGTHMRIARTGPGSGHQQGIGAVLTGQPLLPGEFCGGIGCFNGTSGWPAGMSIDQCIADGPAGGARLRSIELGVRVMTATNRDRVSHRGPNLPLPPDDSPTRIYERLFAGVGESRAALRHRREARGSVLDLHRTELFEIRERIAREQRHAIDAHLESIREIERELDREADARACRPPEIGDPFDPHDTRRYPDASRTMLDMLATALACDATRVATVLYSGAASMQTFRWIGIPEAHHPLSHEPDSDEEARRKLVRIDAWYAGEVARFAQRLASIPEGDGTMLDHTIIFWGNELAKGNLHLHENMHFVVLGGSRTGLRLGRWLDLGDRPHADLLLTFAHAMGRTELDSFGADGWCTGPISELYG